MNDRPKINDAVDTTDCLEAIGAFKSMKNLLFLVTILAMLAVQGVFWLNYAGYIDLSESPYKVVGDPVQAVVPEPVSPEPQPAESTESAKLADQERAEDIDIKVKAEGVLSDLKLTEPAEATDEKDQPSQADQPEAALDIGEKSSAKLFSKFIPKYEHAFALLKVSNFVLVFSATLYCLVLLMSVKVSLVGRLGGMTHICRAFFLSLFALVILLPWQGLFDGIVLGSIYTPKELFSSCTVGDGSTIIGKVFYFARFTGMWVIVMLLLLAAQIRSGRWSKTTLKRLGIIR